MAEQKHYPEVRAVPRSFFRTPLCTDMDKLNADIAFLGVPFDQGTGTFRRPGARYGPDGLRDVQRVYDYTDFFEDKEGQGFFDIDVAKVLLRGVTMVDCGNVTIIPSDVEKNFEKVTTAVRYIIKRGAFPMIIGGDHAITFPSIRAFDSYSSLDIVHFDAHLDFNHHNQTSLYTASNPIRRASELPFVRNITSIGVRDATEQAYKESQEYGVKVITVRQLKAMGAEATVAQVPQAENIYVTMDVDVLDPTHAPGTGIPVPGGLTFYELRDVIRAVTQRGLIVGFDVVELAPAYDWAEITTRNIARLILDVLGLLFPSKEQPVK